ncbi:unnamed protein product [Gulo gulo]|uniref:Secreted protein n=1 Tax=Gulo gulo TaxID=48420 RepID=A0A9X9M493_GULGU|nr:unnamed protein product [Gulo gulo]
MKVVILITFLLVTAHCTPIRELHSARPYHPLLCLKLLQRLSKSWSTCRKPPISRPTTIVPMPPFPPITPLNPDKTVPRTPDRRGDS